MRVVSFVPSWTETFLWAGVNVVGRTRFCIHPLEIIKTIPIVGGTKDMDLEKIKSLQPDLVIFDREENTEGMALTCPAPWHATHVVGIADMPRELRQLAALLKADKLNLLAERWEKVIAAPRPSPQIPALIQWIGEPPQDLATRTAVYVIWAHPWMAAGPDTFVGSLCEWLGWKLWAGETKYPQFEPSQHKNAVFLCSSEPYPFVKKQNVLAELPGPIALVDGEKVSWFGLRSLEYLESLIRVR